MNYFTESKNYYIGKCYNCFRKDISVHAVIELPYNTRAIMSDIPIDRYNLTKYMCNECVKSISETRSLIDKRYERT